MEIHHHPHVEKKNLKNIFWNSPYGAGMLGWLMCKGYLYQSNSGGWLVPAVQDWACYILKKHRQKN